MKIKAICWSILTIAIFLFTEKATACFIGSPSDLISDLKEYNYFVRDYNKAEAIFLGKVIEKDRFRVKFKISKVWKGSVPDNFVMSTGAFPREKGDVISISSCNYSFVSGESYLVYAERNPFSYEGFGSFNNRYGGIPAEYKPLLWASKSSRTRFLKEAQIGVKNLNKLARTKN